MPPLTTAPDSPLDEIHRVTVLGCGLLGGSIALAVQAQTPDAQVTLWGRRQSSIDAAHQVGVSLATTDLAEAVREADLIILASPVGAMLSILETAQSLTPLAGKLITDVGSVKLTPRDSLGEFVSSVHAFYLGSHPMAGSEQAGVNAARADLFQGAACVMTNDFSFPGKLVTLLEHFWQTLGCHCHLTTSEQHDEVMARISHFPHILAAIGAEVALKDPADITFAGNGVRDTTRVASGHPEMWAEILLRNRAALEQPIKDSISRLTQVLAALENSREEELMQWLTHAKELRDQLH